MALALPAIGALGLGFLFSNMGASEEEEVINDEAGAVPESVRTGGGTVEYAPPERADMGQAPGTGFNHAETQRQINRIPGRYDNLPRLKTAGPGYKSSSFDLQPWHLDSFDYAGRARPQSMLERQFHTLTPQETPLSYGVLPQMKRGTGTALPDPISGADLKPQKRELLDTDVFVAHGDTLPSRFQFNPVQTGELQRRTREQAKINTGSGALNHFTHVIDEPGSADNALRGFSTGEVMSKRTGGFHPRERYHRVDETKRGRNQHGLRALNPTQATWHAGSIYQTGTAPLGILRENRNADVRDYHRPPERTGGIGRRHVRAPNEFVDLPHTDRDTGNDPGLRKASRQLRSRRRGKAGGDGFEPDGPVYDPDDVWGHPAGDGLEEGFFTDPTCRDDPTRQSTARCWTAPGGRGGFAQESRRELDMYVEPKNLQDFQLEGWETAAHDSQIGMYGGNYATRWMDLQDRATNRATYTDGVTRAPAPGKRSGNHPAYSHFDQLRGNGFDTTVQGRAGGGVRGENMTADGFSAQRFQEVQLRNTQKDDWEMVANEAVHAPVEDRRLAMQLPPYGDFACPITRRAQPTVVNSLDYGGTLAHRQNPYTQPLPNPGLQVY